MVCRKHLTVNTHKVAKAICDNNWLRFFFFFFFFFFSEPSDVVLTCFIQFQTYYS